jgi:hypothetical protein
MGMLEYVLDYCNIKFSQAKVKACVYNLKKV